MTRTEASAGPALSQVLETRMANAWSRSLALSGLSAPARRAGSDGPDKMITLDIRAAFLMLR